MLLRCGVIGDLKISWRYKITNEEVLRRVYAQLHFVRDMRKRNLEYTGHVLRGSSGESYLYLLDCKISKKGPEVDHGERG